MSRWTSYLTRAADFIGTYTGAVPLAPVLREYYRGYKKMGSTDRRIVSDLVYGYYRLGHAARGLPVEERVLRAYAATLPPASASGALPVGGSPLPPGSSPAPSPLLAALRPDWIALAWQPLPERLRALDIAWENIFPWTDRLSTAVDPLGLALSHLQQPSFYIRVRPGHDGEVRAWLGKANVPFEEAGAAALRLPPATDLTLPMDRFYVVQDLNSQAVGGFLSEAFASLGPAPQVWDCCAASGGKSILVKDLCPGARLTVSDVRPSILHNLDKRFASAGIQYERSLVADLSARLPSLPSFDLVLADVPCSGSGTWSRTPEQLYFFSAEKIDEYARLQRSILQNVARAVRPGGYLLLVTCSVFRSENEDNAALVSSLGFSLRSQRVLAGYGQGADTLFAALLQRDPG